WEWCFGTFLSSRPWDDTGIRFWRYVAGLILRCGMQIMRWYEVPQMRKWKRVFVRLPCRSSSAFVFSQALNLGARGKRRNRGDLHDSAPMPPPPAHLLGASGPVSARRCERLTGQ